MQSGRGIRLIKGQQRGSSGQATGNGRDVELRSRTPHQEHFIRVESLCGFLYNAAARANY